MAEGRGRRRRSSGRVRQWPAVGLAAAVVAVLSILVYSPSGRHDGTVTVGGAAQGAVTTVGGSGAPGSPAASSSAPTATPTAAPTAGASVSAHATVRASVSRRAVHGGSVNAAARPRPGTGSLSG